MKRRISTYPWTLFLLLSAGCSNNSFDCSDIQKGQWAIEFFDELGEDGDCPYEGIAILDDAEYELECVVEGKQCVCNAGDEFGVYDVTVTNTETGDVDRALIEVEAAPSPICLTRDAVGDLTPEPSGGAGGEGGAEN